MSRDQEKKNWKKKKEASKKCRQSQQLKKTKTKNILLSWFNTCWNFYLKSKEQDIWDLFKQNSNSLEEMKQNKTTV